ncbi:serine/threonine-protein kinase ULK4-like [Nerophis ophidion]|uniref:serine/threonine-protein kinase ULK4-like n=1 Tax=Nerophis ophidion TaxID=159077 RepID=UPI002AE02ADB|nr:serine/threonine-protein kinase ULK4-like [Nerophis ophidion]
MENINLYEEMGRNYTSIVYKGRRMGTLNYVALKCIDKSKRPEVTNHVRLSQNLDHPNIVEFYEWYETRKHLWLVLELCTGGSLESVIVRDGCFPEDVVRMFGLDLVKGLEYIHNLGIIFSDLTPAKILLDNNGILKLGNFCHSKTEKDTFEDFILLYEEAGSRKYDNVKKRFQGSPIYTAPEVLQGSETTVSSDLWALGCILQCMYTGKPPFMAKTYKKLLENILHQEPSLLIPKESSTPPPSQEFQNLLKGLLNKKPNKRMNSSDLQKHHFWTLTDGN